MQSVRSIIITSLLLVVILGLLFAPPVTGQTPNGSVPNEPGNTGQFNAIRGQVTDEQENPLPGYVVEAISLPDEVTYSVKTTQDGNFELADLHEGVWYLRVKFHGTTIEYRKIRLCKGMESEINFAIKANGSVFGFLVDSASQAPLNIDGDIYIGLLTKFNTVERSFRGRVSGGSFEVKNLLPGRYIVMDSFRGYVFDMPKAPEVTVHPEGSTGGIEVFLKSGALVHGRIMDTNGQPISGVTVKIASAKLREVQPRLEFGHSIQTNNDGKFSITTPNEPEEYRSFSVMVNHSEYQAQLIHTDFEQKQSEYELPNTVMQKTLILKGKIRKSVAPPGEQMKVILKRHNKPVGFFDFFARSEMEVYTDTKNNFAFEGLYPTEYSLGISINGVIRYFIESVNPQERSHLEIRLAKTQILRGHVMDEDNQPLEGARVDATMKIPASDISSIPLAYCRTDSDGAFQLELLKVKPKHLRIRIAKSGYLSNVYRNIRITKKELPVVLLRGHSIKGHVFAPHYLPLDSNYSIKLFPADLPMDATIDPLFMTRPLVSELSQSGEMEFSIDGLPPKKYTLYVMGKQFAAAGTTVDLIPGDQKAFLFAKEKLTDLYGRVLWADTGKPVPKASVKRSWYPWELEIYDNMSSMKRFELETDENGMFKFLNLTPGHYILSISHSDVYYESASDSPKRNTIHKQLGLTVSNSNKPYVFYLGRRDGSSFAMTKL